MPDQKTVLLDLVADVLAVQGQGAGQRAVVGLEPVAEGAREGVGVQVREQVVAGGVARGLAEAGARFVRPAELGALGLGEELAEALDFRQLFAAGQEPQRHQREQRGAREDVILGAGIGDRAQGGGQGVTVGGGERQRPLGAVRVDPAGRSTAPSRTGDGSLGKTGAASDTVFIPANSTRKRGLCLAKSTHPMFTALLRGT